MDAISTATHQFSQPTQVETVSQSSQQGNVARKQVTQTSIKETVPETKEEVKALVNKLNNDLEPLNTGLSFGYSEDVEQLVITVQDKNSGRIIRKFPTEEALKLAAKMKDVVGMIFDQKV